MRGRTAFRAWQGRLHLLYQAQDQQCFHCGEIMVLGIQTSLRDTKGWSREHVYPRSSTGRGLMNNIVLAHPLCNSLRGDRQPTADEIRRAVAVYEKIGVVPFQPSGPDAETTQMYLVGHHVSMGTFASIWPKTHLTDG